MEKTLKKITASYNKSAACYDLMNRVYFLGRDKEFRSMMVRRLKLKPNDTVLVLCCGTGLDFPYLLRQTQPLGLIVGVDLSPKMLHQAKRKIGSGSVNLVRSDAAHLPFPDGCFDAIIVSFCLKITPAYRQTVGESVRVLKSSGRMGILANKKPSEPLKLLGILFTKVLGAMAKINFEIKLEEHLSGDLRIVDDRKLYGGLVRILVAKKGD